MGRRGPKPQPTTLRVLRGNPGKRALNPAEPTPAPARSVKTPKWLTGRAAKIWRELAPKLHAAGLLTDLDVRQLAMLCAHWARWQALYEAGPEATDLTTVGLLRRESEIVQKLSAQFGLTPSARVGLKVAAPKAVDPLMAFVKGA